MNRLSLPIFAIAFLFLPLARGEEIRKYQLVSEGGHETATTIVWDNIDGLGKVSGNFHYAAGDQSFHGTNPEPGVLRLTTENGIRYDLVKLQGDQGITWVGQVHFTEHSENARLVPVRKMAAAGSGANAPAEHRGDARHYIARGSDGTEIAVSIIWSDIEGNGPVEGHFQFGKSSIAFTGENPSDGYLRLKDDLGNRYEFRKVKNDRSLLVWAGTATNPQGKVDMLTLTAK